jgi:hypothetical protein
MAIAVKLRLPIGSDGEPGPDVHAPPVPDAVATATISPSGRVPSKISTVTVVTSLAVPENEGATSFDGVCGVLSVTVGACSPAADSVSCEAPKIEAFNAVEASAAGTAKIATAVARTKLTHTARAAARDFECTIPRSRVGFSVPRRTVRSDLGDVRGFVRRDHRREGSGREGVAVIVQDLLHPARTRELV